MLIGFTVGNYRSFKEKVTLSMVAANIKSEPGLENVDENNVFSAGKLNLLKSAVIYGANASGKSNLIRAIHFIRNLVLHSSKEAQAGEEISIANFRLVENYEEESPCFFEMVFILEGKKYRYGFEASPKSIHREWLFYTPTTRETKLFKRENGKILIARVFPEGKALEEKTRDNALFLSVVAQFNGPISSKILEWFRNTNAVNGLEIASHINYPINCLNQDNCKNAVLQFIKELDLSIKEISLEKVTINDEEIPKDIPDEVKKAILETPLIVTEHNKYDDQGNIKGTRKLELYENESEGTKKLFALSGRIVKALQNGNALLIDEFEARLHPLIARNIIQLFNSPKTNPNNAQLIITVQDTTLLDKELFRRDQIWFLEKDRSESSHLYSLAEFERNDASYQKNYIRGKYGAIPYIGDLSRLFGK